MVDDGLHNATINVSEPYRHHGANDEQHRQRDDVFGFTALPPGYDKLDEFEDPFPKLLVNVALSSGFFGLICACLLLLSREGLCVQLFNAVKGPK